MMERLVFDDRLLNRYAVEDLAQSQPRLHAALLAWFAAFADFDETSINRLLGARGPGEVDRWTLPAQAALAAIPDLVQTLDTVQLELHAALSGSAAFAERAQLESLLQSAQANRKALVEHASALVARALASNEAYGEARAAATAAVEHAAQRLEQLRARSEDAAPSYRELQPMVAELQDVWHELNRALAALSRQDQRGVREPQDSRMRAAAGAVCRNLFLRKMQDRARGLWPPPEIAPPDDSAPEQFAAALARGDYAAAHATLAPWLADGWTAERLAGEVLRSARDIAHHFNLSEPPPAGAYRVGSNPLRYQDVRELRDLMLPGEITAENYQGWFILQVQTEAEDGYLTDIDYLANLQVVAVSTRAGDRIGYLRFAE